MTKTFEDQCDQVLSGNLSPKAFAFFVGEGDPEELLKDKLAEEHNIPRDAKFDLAWNIAYDFGHSCGLSEVEYYFDTIVVLIK